MILAQEGAVTSSEAGHDVNSELADVYRGLRNPLAHALQVVDDSIPALRKLARMRRAVAHWTQEADSAGR